VRARHARLEKQFSILFEKYKIEAIAIGNGTAGRETELFVRNLNLPGVTIVMVNESGASIYSASDVAREEFPDKDITVRVRCVYRSPLDGPVGRAGEDRSRNQSA
jgi:transcriptional accessory protein Tex/SPT6